jgi:hypothetical protein
MIILVEQGVRPSASPTSSLLSTITQPVNLYWFRDRFFPFALITTFTCFIALLGSSEVGGYEFIQLFQRLT